MKIDYLRINSQFKNLLNVKVDFDETNLMTVIVGPNGSGKSNVLEALVSIFRNLDLGEAPPFSYEVMYRLGRGDNTKSIKVVAETIDAPLGKQYTIEVTDHEGAMKVVPLSKVKRDKQGKSPYLPKYLFAYYSGPSDRLELYFRKHRTEFYKKLLNNKVDLKGEIRPLFYAKPFHSQFVLLAFFLGEHNDAERNFLSRHLGIESLDSVHFVMRRPAWAKNRDELFWGASGVVRDFLDALYPHTLAPIKATRQEDTTLTGSNIKNEFLHLYVPNVDSLKKFSDGLSQDVFFKMLESTLLSEIISEVSIRVKVKTSDIPLTFKELSEGEQQLLTVLGLLKFTGGEDSLFLLDEPDTHLNPAWAVNYLNFLREFVPNHETSHLLMVTHHPLAIAELEKEQIQVMWRDPSNQISATAPAESPKGMGYAGILTSDMFGLRSTLDAPTESLIRARRELAEKTYLSAAEKTELAALDEQIESLGFTTAHWDKQYQEYLQVRKEFEGSLYSEGNASPEAIAARKAKARKIISEIIAREDTDEADEIYRI